MVIFHSYVSHYQRVTCSLYPPLKQVTFFTSPSDHSDADLRGTAHARCGGLCIRCWIPEDWLRWNPWNTWNTSPWELMNFPGKNTWVIGISIPRCEFRLGKARLGSLAIFRLLKAEATAFRHFHGEPSYERELAQVYSRWRVCLACGSCNFQLWMLHGCCMDRQRGRVAGWASGHASIAASLV